MTANPDLKTTNSGKSVTEFSLAVDNFKDGEKQTDFILCQAWGNKADVICKYVAKGDKIAIFGKIHTDKYKDTNGNDRYKTYIKVSEIDFMSKPKQTENTEDISDDDLPF